MHAFLSNLANRQTVRQTPAITFTSSFVGGKNALLTHSSRVLQFDGRTDGRKSDSMAELLLRKNVC